MINKIHSFITQHYLIPNGSTVIIGLSGGPDSVFLLHTLAQLARDNNWNLIAAHLDHGWRTNSASDVAFCQQLAHDLNIPFLATHANDLNIKIKFNGSKEEVGRKLRRHFFNQVAQQHSTQVVALAHHAQDQQETFFLRLLRGSTLTGLTCMKPKQGIFVRPLLATNKGDIINYLQENRIPFLNDPTNTSNDFLRNRIRSAVIPALKTADARFDTTFSTTIAALQETELFLEELALKTLNQLTIANSFAINEWALLHPVLQKKVLVQWLYTHKLPFEQTASFIDEIIRFLMSEKGGTHQLHPTWSIMKKQGNAFIELNQ